MVEEAEEEDFEVVVVVDVVEGDLVVVVEEEAVVEEVAVEDVRTGEEDKKNENSFQNFCQRFPLGQLLRCVSPAFLESHNDIVHHKRKSLRAKLNIRASTRFFQRILKKKKKVENPSQISNLDAIAQ